MNSQGKVVDIEAVRVNVKKMRKAYQQLGSRLDLMIIKEAQKRTLAGESINYKGIERDIILAYRPFPWGQVFQWLFVPYVPALMKIYKRSLDKDKDV